MNALKAEQGDPLLACRICLAWDTKLFSIHKCGLDEVFTDVVGTTLSWDSVPQHVCAWCRAGLLHARALRARCRRADALLKHQHFLSWDGVPRSVCAWGCCTRVRCRRADALLKHALAHQHFITNKFIQTIDRTTHKLTHNLTVNHLPPPETCVHQETEMDTSFIKDEIEIDVTENIDLQNDEDFKSNDFNWTGDDTNDYQVGDIIVAPVKADDEFPWPTSIDDEIDDNVTIAALKHKEREKKKEKRATKKPRLTKKNRFRTEGYFKEFEEKYDFEVKFLTEEEMVEDMERRKLSEKYVQGEFKCELCCRGFSTSTAYDNHVKDKHDLQIGPNECHLCHVRYRHAVNRNQHVQDAHRLQFRCRRCHRLVPGESHAVEHAASHDGATFKCRHCDKRFLKKTTCATHMRLDHPAENAAGGTCEVCGETFISRTGLNCHKTRAHNKPYNRKLHCPKCRIQFDSLEALERHKIGRPGNKCDPHGSVCCACGEWSENADALVLHRHMQHGTALFTCDECSKSFLSKVSLCTHMDRVHRGVRPARLARPERERNDPGSRAGKVCETCGKLFQCLALLKQHQARHTGEKSFKCEICPKAYATAAELRTHHVRHTGEKPYKCEICTKCYGTAAALKVHVEAVHIRLRKYRCDQCPKTFLRATGLYVHKVVHTGEKRFECSLCGARFTQAGSLATHRKYVHLKLKPPPRKRNKQ